MFVFLMVETTNVGRPQMARYLEEIESSGNLQKEVSYNLHPLSEIELF
jgi:hypothetical protein